jgi:hypothetical protein
MSVPTRYNPKRLSDYTLRGGRMKPGRGVMRYGPTAAERTATSRKKYKEFVMADIAASDQRRKGLEAMWQREVAKRDADRKGAVDDYNTVMETAPDFSDDDTGEMRAAWENQDHVKAAKERMRAHIEASLQETRGAVDLRVDPQSAEMGRAEHGSKFQPLAPKFRGGFGQAPKALPTDPKAGVTGELRRKGNEVFIMGLDENGKVVGFNRKSLAKKKKPPEEEPTGAEYRGSEAITGAARGLIHTSQREDAPYTP